MPVVGDYGWLGFTIMAVPTAAVFAVLDAAILLVAWQESDWKWSLDRKTTAAFAGGLVLLLFLGVSIHRSTLQLNEMAGRLTHSEQVLGRIASVLAEMANAQTHTRGYVLTGDQRYLKSHLSATVAARDALDTLRPLIAGSPHQQQEFARLEPRARETLQWFQQVLDARRNGLAAVQPSQIHHGEDLMDDLRARIEQMENEERRFLRQAMLEADGVSRFVHRVTLIGAVASSLIFLTVLVGLNRAEGRRQRVEEVLRASEVRFREIFEQAAVGIAQVGMDGRWLRVNQRLCDIVEYPREELLQCTFQEITHPEDLNADLAFVRQVLAGEISTYSMEKRCIRKDRGLVWVHLTVALVRDETGAPKYFVSVLEDITRRKQAEHALSLAVERLRRFVDANIVGVVIADAAGAIVEANDYYLRLLGYTREDLEHGRVDWRAITPPEWLPADEQAIRELRERGTCTPYEKEYLRRDGGRVAVLIADALLPGPVEQIAAFAVDITERKRAEEALQQSEARFRRAVLDSPFPIMLHAEDGTILQASNSWCEITGYTREELATVADWTERAYGERKTLVQGGIDRLYDLGHRLAEGDFTIRTKSGSTRIWEFSSAPLGRLPDGRRLVISMAMDVTERRQAEQSLAALFSRQEAILAAVPDIITEVDNDRIYTWANQAGLAFFGDDVIGREAAFYFVGEQTTYQSVQPLFDDQQDLLYVESWQRRKDGQLRLLAWRCRVLKDENGNVTGALSSARDITEHKAAEVQLTRTLAELERSNKELEQFAYVASHDLQEPLRMISSFTQLLAQRYEGQLDDKAQQYIRYAVDGALRLQTLIDDLLAYSRVGTRGQPLEPADSHAVLGEAIRNLVATIGENRAIITNDDLPMVRADAAQLVLVFQNLLSNAIKFRREEVPRVHVSAQDHGGEWVFSVQDNGIGIEPQHAERIFVIFQRLHTREEYPGTGIGLAVCKRIVERHGGKIWFESEPGNGTKFFFSVPK
jgi:PAS domain S-box-containing protein